MTPHDPDHLPLLQSMALDSNDPLEALAASDLADCKECRAELNGHLQVERLLNANDSDFRTDLERGRALPKDQLVGLGSAASILGAQLPKAAPEASQTKLRLLQGAGLLAAAAALLVILRPDPAPAPLDYDPMLGGSDSTIELILAPTPTFTWPAPPAGGWSDLEVRSLTGEVLQKVPELEAGSWSPDPAQWATWPNEIEFRVRTFEASTRERSSSRQVLQLR